MLGPQIHGQTEAVVSQANAVGQRVVGLFVAQFVAMWVSQVWRAPIARGPADRPAPRVAWLGVRLGGRSAEEDQVVQPFEQREARIRAMALTSVR